MIASVLEQASTAFEVIGVAVIIAGSIFATISCLMQWRQLGSTGARYRSYRNDLGRAILLGLEFLVAGDIIGTIAAPPTFESLALLAFVIVIRTFLSFALETEIHGQWPWRRREAEPQSTGPDED